MLDFYELANPGGNFGKKTAGGWEYKGCALYILS